MSRGSTPNSATPNFPATSTRGRSRRLGIWELVIGSGVVALTLAGPARAQSPYVGASVVADVVRRSGASGDSFVGNGEAVGGALRVGTPLGAQWGVDLEFTRSAEMETVPEVRILADLIVGRFPGTILPAIFPPPDIESRMRLSTLNTTLWWRQDVSERFDLMYVGGVAFSRTTRQLSVNFGRPVLPAPLGGVISVPSFEQESVAYDAGIIVGLDGRIHMTDHLRLVPGLRLLTVPSGWVVRPAVGLSWEF